MEEFKGALASKTVWGGLITLGSGIAAIWGYGVAPEDQAALSELLAGLFATGGSILVIVGRLVATKRIT